MYILTPDGTGIIVNMRTSTIKLPRQLPLLVIDKVLFPGASIRISVTSYRNLSLVKNHLLSRNTLSSAIIGIVPREPGSDGEEDVSAMHRIGTAGIVVQVTGTNWPKVAYTLLVTGLCRFRLEGLVQESPYLIGSVFQLDKLPGEEIEDENSAELSELKDQFRDQAAKLVDMLDLSLPAVVRLKRLLGSLPVQSLLDVCASIVRATQEERLEILDTIDIAERLRKILPLLLRQIENIKLLQNSKKDEGITRSMQVEKIVPIRGNRQKFDFDDEDMEEDDIILLERKIKAAGIPAHVQKVAVKELQRLKKMPPHMPEHAMTRNYLELMTELPWSKISSEVVDITKSRKDLDEDHYGMQKLKKRVLEYLAVRQLRKSLKGPILCFVGPPGVGKTSVGRSIAKSLGREFHRISLGGACDQADIRGHRRTYIGSMPGRIIQGLKTVGTKNPVFLLDEIDKMNAGIHGDPAAALLEVLDPEQNCSFTDHYLNVPFDLSQVLFIATANTMTTIPPALLDRMEVIPVPGYTYDEKQHIARNHLLPKQLKEHGLSNKLLIIQDEAIKTIILKYTREAGVRSLERKLGAVCRAVAVKVVECGKETLSVPESEKLGEKLESISNSDQAAMIDLPPDLPVVVDETAVEDILGPAQYDSEVTARLGQPGVAVGLAWTLAGGEIMFVEATKMDGDGQLILTGQLGEVMKESAKLALNWVRCHAEEYGIPVERGIDLMESTDVHIHFPAGAVEKDGPSAGVTIVTVLVSLFTGRLVESDVAMTGEITLRGLVLPVGGIKEKVLAAHQAGMRRVILPKKNEKDLIEIPQSVKDDLVFELVSHLKEVLKAAFEGGFPFVNQCAEMVPSKL